jgi:hypothetical protein
LQAFFAAAGGDLVQGGEGRRAFITSPIPPKILSHQIDEGLEE